MTAWFRKELLFVETRDLNKEFHGNTVPTRMPRITRERTIAEEAM
jgi:hypothetical protein